MRSRQSIDTKSSVIVRFVLDAWAILALLQGEEPAATRVAELLSQLECNEIEVFASVVNLGEVYYRIGRAKGEEEAARVLDTLRQAKIAIVPASDERVLAAARFKMRHSMSYADAFAAATADSVGGTLVTGDPELIALAGQIVIEKLERRSPR